MRKPFPLRCLFLFLSLCLLLGSCTASASRPHDGSDSETSEETTSILSAPRKRVALTFDDGPHNTRTAAIVDELAKYGWHATFFVVGNRVDGAAYAGGAALEYAYMAGNEIGIHGYTHTVYYDTCTEAEFSYELGKTLAAIEDRIPSPDVTRMRPVGGRITSARAEECGYEIALWTVDSEDWKYKYQSGDTEAECREKVDAIVHNILRDLQDGDVILMHDIYESSYDAVAELLPKLEAAGFEVVSLRELQG